MIVVDNERVQLSTPYGPMQTHIVRPAAPGKYPGIVFYSEIFQVTGPIRRTAAMLAGHGYIVAVPEIYHEFEPAGTVLAYDQAGADRGNVLKTSKELASFDADARAVLDHLKSRPDCTGQLGAMGLHRRPSRIPCGHESHVLGSRVLLCNRHTQGKPGQGNERRFAAAR